MDPPGFVLHHLFDTVTAEQLLHVTTLVATGVGLYFLLRDSLKDRTAAAVASAAWSCYTWIHGDGGWNYHVAGAIAYHVWALWALVRAAVAPSLHQRRWWAVVAGALLACAVHTHTVYAGFVGIMLLVFVVPPITSARAGAARVASAVAWLLVGGIAITALLAVINVATGGRWLFFVPQLEYTLLVSRTGNRYLRPPAEWLPSARHLVIPTLIVAAGIAWLFTARRAYARDHMRAGFATVFVVQGLIAVALMLYLQFVAGQTAFDPQFFAYPLYTQIFPILGVVLASWQPEVRGSLGLASAALLAIVAPLLLLLPSTMPAFVARLDASLGLPPSMIQLVPLAIGALAAVVMARQGYRSRLATCAVVYGVLNTWLCASPSAYGLRTPGINRDVLTVLDSLDRYTARLDPSLFGIRYWRERDHVKGPQGDVDLYYVFDGFLSTRRRSLLTLAYDRQETPIDQLEPVDLYGQRCVGVLSAKETHARVVARMSRRFNTLGLPLTEIGRHEVGSGPISVALTVLMVPTEGPCTACAPVDADIQRDIETRLTGIPTLTNRDLSVAVKGCVASVRGRTQTSREQEQVLTLARTARGVARVENELLVHNADLAERIRAALAADALVGHIGISVDAFGSQAWLTSTSTNEAERTRAVAVASAVPGVTHVTDDMK